GWWLTSVTSPVALACGQPDPLGPNSITAGRVGRDSKNSGATTNNFSPEPAAIDGGSGTGPVTVGSITHVSSPPLACPPVHPIKEPFGESCRTPAGGAAIPRAAAASFWICEIA